MNVAQIETDKTMPTENRTYTLDQISVFAAHRLSLSGVPLHPNTGPLFTKKSVINKKAWEISQRVKISSSCLRTDETKSRLKWFNSTSTKNKRQIKAITGFTFPNDTKLISSVRKESARKAT